jgi:hypothetical protein
VELQKRGEGRLGTWLITSPSETGLPAPERSRL